MNNFFNFIINHWILWLIFFLIILIIIFEEIRGRVYGVPRLQPQDLTRLINREEGIVVDLRDAVAFSKGHIINSINIPHTELDANVERLKKYQNKPIVLVCSNGQTAPQEGAKLRKKGLEQVYFLTGGIQAWQEAGYPLTTRD